MFALGVTELEMPADCAAQQVLEAARAQALAESDSVGLSERSNRQGSTGRSAGEAY